MATRMAAAPRASSHTLQVDVGELRGEIVGLEALELGEHLARLTHRLERTPWRRPGIGSVGVVGGSEDGGRGRQMERRSGVDIEAAVKE